MYCWRVSGTTQGVCELNEKCTTKPCDADLQAPDDYHTEKQRCRAHALDTGDRGEFRGFPLSPCQTATLQVRIVVDFAQLQHCQSDSLGTGLQVSRLQHVCVPGQTERAWASSSWRSLRPERCPLSAAHIARPPPATAAPPVVCCLEPGSRTAGPQRTAVGAPSPGTRRDQLRRRRKGRTDPERRRARPSSALGRVATGASRLQHAADEAERATNKTCNSSARTKLRTKQTVGNLQPKQNDKSANEQLQNQRNGNMQPTAHQLVHLYIMPHAENETRDTKFSSIKSSSE